MKDDYLIGIDAGTSKTKVVLFDTRGNELYKASRDNIIISSNSNWMEQDMEHIWNNTLDGLKEVTDSLGADRINIRAIGVAGQGEGCWLIDEYGKPVRNAIIWSDSRAAALTYKIKKEFNKAERIRRITGSHIFPGATSIILKWLKENERESLERAKYCFFCKDWIRYRLTQRVGIEFTDASTSVLDLDKHEISKELFKILDIEEYMALFPKLSYSMDLSGNISPRVAKKALLSENTAVCMGMMDVVSTALGAGAIEKGDTCIILGTTCCNEVVTEDHDKNEDMSGYEEHVIEGLYLNVVASMAGTPNLDWFVNEFFSLEKEEADKKEEDIFDILEDMIKEESAVKKGIIYHPYISSSGERAPFYNPNARAQFFGISQYTNKNTMLRAIYEGIAFSIKDCLQRSRHKGKIYLTGGGAKSSIWPQIIADCTGREVTVLGGNEFSAKGAAILAGIGLKIYKDIKEAKQETMSSKKEFIPNKEDMSIYDEFFPIYQKLRINNNELWNERNKIIERLE